MNINATIIGQTIAFAFFVWFCMQYVWPPIMQILEHRKKEIANGLAAATRGKKELELTQEKINEQLSEAREKAKEIIELANKRASQIINTAKGQALIESDRIKKVTQVDIEQAVNKAREVLRNQVAILAVAGAERILYKNLDESANSHLLDDLVAKL